MSETTSPRAVLSFKKFEHRAPSAQTAVDVFAGRWASDLSGVAGVEHTGAAGLFLNDPRPGWAAQAFGKGSGRLDGMRVLELGPLEAGHSFQLEQLGAREVVAVDSNAEAYLKCLVVKEVLGLRRCRFLLGDALAYLQTTTERFDLVFCSGLLYEVADPLALIKACCTIGQRCFVWTHYHDPGHPEGDGGRVARKVKVDGVAATYFEDRVANLDSETFWGGNTDVRAWMTRQHLLDAFRRYGLDDVRVLEDMPAHPNGAAITFTAAKEWSETFVRVTAPPRD